jgi:hypothetical protein
MEESMEKCTNLVNELYFVMVYLFQEKFVDFGLEKKGKIIKLPVKI